MFGACVLSCSWRLIAHSNISLQLTRQQCCIVRGGGVWSVLCSAAAQARSLRDAQYCCLLRPVVLCRPTPSHAVLCPVLCACREAMQQVSGDSKGDDGPTVVRYVDMSKTRCVCEWTQ